MRFLKFLLLVMVILMACPQVYASESPFKPHKIKIGVDCHSCYFSKRVKNVGKGKYEIIEVKNIIKEMEYGVYDVFETCDGVHYTTEEINTIVDFVKKGGGLIIVDDRSKTTDSMRILLQKLGIKITESELSGSGLISLDGKSMINHPITTGVETLQWTFGVSITSISITDVTGATKIIRYPSVLAVKEFGEGRIVIVPRWIFCSTHLSHPRITYNLIEWVAGYTPEGWEPDVTSLVAKYRELASKCNQTEVQMLRSNYQELENKYNKLKSECERLKEENERLKAQIKELNEKSAENKGASTSTSTETVPKATKTPGFEAVLGVAALAYALRRFSQKRE